MFGFHADILWGKETDGGESKEWRRDDNNE